jgi:LCP family protein required for cell wall assembly
MQKKVLKISVFLCLVAATFTFAFFYEFLTTTNKVFSAGKREGSTPIFKQFADMVISPSQSLRGEEDGQINILLLGVGGSGHSGGLLTDTIMIFSLKPRTHEAALLSIPRDLYVEVQGTNIKTKINAVKVMGDNQKSGQGIVYLESTVKDITGLDIDYYAQLDFAGFIRIVDSMCGIDVYLEKDIDDQTYPDAGFGYDPFRISKGWHHLDGATALKVARSRHSGNGDFDRMRRQQAIMVAFRQKLYEKYASFDLLAFREMFLSLTENLKTDAELQEFPRFYQIMKEVKSNNFTSSTVDTQNYLQKVNVGLGYSLGTRSGDYSGTSELGKNIFDMKIPESKVPLIAAEGALIAIENGTGSPDLANTITADLEALGLRIISSSNIDPPDFSGVFLRFKAGTQQTKYETLNFLAEKFTAKTEITNDESQRADFVLVLGKGF